MVAEEPEKLDIYLVGAPLTRLLAEVVVGTVDIEGAAIRVPPPLLPRLVARLDTARPDQRSGVLQFVAVRCDAEFAREFLEPRPALLRAITRPGMYISGLRPEIMLLRLLTDKQVMPEAAHSDFVEHLAEIAVEGPDPAWCTQPFVRSLLNDVDLRRFGGAVRDALLNDVEAICEAVDSSNYDGPTWGTPEEWVEPLREAAKSYRREFKGDQEVQTAIKTLESYADRLVEELTERYADAFVGGDGPPVPARPVPSPQEEDLQGSARDPFDDVDGGDEP
jgi:hypothetical protein